MREEAEQLEFAGLSEELVPFLEFLIDLILVEKPRVERLAVRDFRQVEQPGSDCPPVLIPLDGCTIGVAPGVGGVIERAGVDDRPVHEIGSRIMGVAVGVEDIDDPELSQREHNAIGGLSAGKLVQARIDVRGFAAQVDRLAEEDTRYPWIRISGADLVGFPTRKSCHAEGIREAKTLIGLGVHPQLRTAPRADASVDGQIEGFPSLLVRIEAVRALEGRAEPRMVLCDEGGLGVETPIFATLVPLSR